MRILGIDYGDKKIGLAFGNSEVGVVLPLKAPRIKVKKKSKESEVLKKFT